MESKVERASCRIRKSDFNPFKIHPFFAGVAAVGMLFSGYNLVNAMRARQEDWRFLHRAIAIYMAAFAAAGYATGVNHRYHKRTDPKINPPRFVDKSDGTKKIDPKFIKMIHNDGYVHQ